MIGSNIKRKGKERNKSVKNYDNSHISLTNIGTYYATINQTYRLLYNTSICQVVTSNIKVNKETKGLNKL